MATKTKIKQTFDVKTIDTPSDLVTTNESQLSVFDYGDIASRYGDNVATELKSLEYEGTVILVDAKIKYGNVLRKGKALVSHGDFERWVMSIWGLEPRRARDLMTVAEANSISAQCAVLFPDKLRPATAMAKAILNAPEDKKEGLVGEIKKKREEKGKDLTEAEIKQLAEKYLKEKEEEIEALKNNQTSLMDELNKAKTEKDNFAKTIENQNKHIQELNSNISAKEKELKDIQGLKTELENKQAHLDSFIIAQASVIATEEIDKEKKVLAKEIKGLKAKEEEIQKELKQVESLRITAQKQKENFDLTTNWLNSFQLTNEYLNEITGKLKQYKKELEKTPDLSQFDDEEKANLEKAIQDQVVDFNDNLHSLGGAINYLNGTIVKFNNHALRVINAEVSE